MFQYDVEYPASPESDSIAGLASISSQGAVEQHKQA